MARQVVAGGGQLHRLLIVGQLADQEVEPLRTLEPPVTEQLGVEQRGDDRRPVHVRRAALDHVDLPAQEVGGVSVRALARRDMLVRLLAIGVAGDPVILEAGEDAGVAVENERPDVLEVQVEADVAIEVAIAGIAGVALVGAPHQPRRGGIAAERGGAVAAAERRQVAVSRSRRGVHDPMRLDEEEAAADLRDDLSSPG